MGRDNVSEAASTDNVADCLAYGEDPGFQLYFVLTGESSIMIRVTSTEFGKEVGRYQDAALMQTVVITRNGRDLTVMISADEYQRLKRRDREVLGIEDFTDAEIEAIRRAEPSPEANAFNHELQL